MSPRQLLAEGAGPPASLKAAWLFRRGKNRQTHLVNSPRGRIKTTPSFHLSETRQCFLSLAVQDGRAFFFLRALLEPFFPILFAGGTQPETTGLSAGCTIQSAGVTCSRIQWLRRPRLLRTQSTPCRSFAVGAWQEHSGPSKKPGTRPASFLFVLLGEWIETGTM